MRNPEIKLIKILIVAPALPLTGGQVVAQSNLIDSFRSETGFKVDLLPINPIFFPALQKIKFVRTALTESKYIWDLIKNVPRYDIIHIFSASYFSFLLAPTPAVLLSKLFSKKTILHYHSGEADDHLKTWRRSAVPTINLFDKIVVPSGFLVDVFAKFGISSQSIHNFVDTGKFQFRQRNPLRPVFFSNRNFEPIYNIACTLKAFSLIQRQIPDAKLLVAGDGSEKKSLLDLADKLKLNNIEFLGTISPKEMPQFYDNADIYLNSSNIDNMPVSIIEAFAAGTAVVSTNPGGIPYILENEKTGLLVNIDDQDALAKASCRLLNDQKLAQKIVQNAHAAAVQFSWDNAREKWIKLYRELVNKS